MENNFLLNDDLLWDYADDLLAEDDKVKVDAFLRQHPEWKERLEAILLEKRALLDLPLDLPRADFSDRVLAAWTAEQVQARASNPAKRRDWTMFAISALFGVFILLPMVTMVVMVFQAGPGGSLPDGLKGIKLPTLDWSLLMGNSMVHYASYFTLAIIALLFTEKYLQHRKVMAQLG